MILLWNIFQCVWCGPWTWFLWQFSQWQKLNVNFKVGQSSSKTVCVICFIETPLKIMKSAFNFILKALFVLKILKILLWFFGHVGKRAWLEK